MEKSIKKESEDIFLLQDSINDKNDEKLSLEEIKEILLFESLMNDEELNLVTDNIPVKLKYKIVKINDTNIPGLTKGFIEKMKQEKMYDKFYLGLMYYGTQTPSSSFLTTWTARTKEEAALKSIADERLNLLENVW